MLDVVGAFVGHEETQRRCHQRAHLIERAGARGAEERLQFGEGQFDRIEVGTVGRENRSSAPACSIATRTSGCLWAARLSSTTTSPGRSVGTRTCSTYARNVTLSIGPSKTAVAVSSVGRSAATTVCVCQWPQGA